MYKINIHNRDYSSWEVFETSNLQPTQLMIDPISEKLFSNDVFNLVDNKVVIVHSSIKMDNSIPAVLVLDGNKTYGRERKSIDSKKLCKMVTGRSLYKCIPDDIRLPPFLVPYDIKSLGFSKVLKNLYVTISFDLWDDKHPKGKLTTVIGPVDVLDNFYEYQLYCRSLNASIQKFLKDAVSNLNTKMRENVNNSCSHNDIVVDAMQKYNIENRLDKTKWKIFTIDSAGSVDFDDAMSLIKVDNDVTLLSIYISNVTVWMDILNLWQSFSKRISTIYLPDKKRPMIPTILSDALCSLKKNVPRIVFTVDIFVKDNIIVEIQYKNTVINVSNNYVYEDYELLSNNKYHEILDFAQKLSKNYNYMNSPRNSNDLVSYLMVLVNYNCAKELIKHKTGIFRSAITTNKCELPKTLPEEVAKFMKNWNSSSGQYLDGSEIVDARHELLDIDAYIHITSPIRRLVDLLNIVKMQKVLNMFTLSENALMFYDKWINDLEYINVTMRSIRKVQNDCYLLELFYKNPEVIDREYTGYLFDKLGRNDGLYQYIVYLPEIKMSSRITLRENIENFNDKKFKLYLLNDEANLKQKVRLQLINNQ
jgi:exoribonuclease R